MNRKQGRVLPPPSPPPPSIIAFPWKLPTCSIHTEHSPAAFISWISIMDHSRGEPGKGENGKSHYISSDRPKLRDWAQHISSITGLGGGYNYGYEDGISSLSARFLTIFNPDYLFKYVAHFWVEVKAEKKQQCKLVPRYTFYNTSIVFDQWLSHGIAEVWNCHRHSIKLSLESDLLDR
jgi:hypothetical protein